MIYRIFISSVQREFAEERRKLAEYIRKDVLLAKFFDVFLFEESPACDRSAQELYLDEVEKSDVYLGLFGAQFGYEVTRGVSATECEYDLATKLKKPRLAFVFEADTRERNEQRFIRKVEREVTRRAFKKFDELQLGVYAALVKFLEQRGYVRVAPFDLAYDTGLTTADLDSSKIAEYIEKVREAGQITVPVNADMNWELAKLEAVSEDGRVSNAAVLLFGKNPQKYFSSSEVKCLHYYGTKVARPIPSYKIYEGGLIQMIDAALEFVMSRIDTEISEPDDNGRAKAKDELPRRAVREAIVNAVCHRDYESNASVQVMLFKNRLHTINPGPLLKGWTVAMLESAHDSEPRNTCIAKALNWAGYAERSGYGTEFIINKCVEHGLARPCFRPDTASFHNIIWRKGFDANGELKEYASSRDPVKTPSQQAAVVGQSRQAIVVGHSRRLESESMMTRIVRLLAKGECARSEIANQLEVSVQAGWFKTKIISLLEDGLVERTIPDKPNSRLQKYRLTDKGRKLVEEVSAK